MIGATGLFIFWGELGDVWIIPWQIYRLLSIWYGRVLLIGRDFVITAIHNGKMAFSGRHKGYFSIYAYSDIAWGVNEIGFKYGLENYTLRSDDPRGISNEFCGQEGIISVEKGTLLICAEGFDGF